MIDYQLNGISQQERCANKLLITIRERKIDLQF